MTKPTTIREAKPLDKRRCVTYIRGMEDDMSTTTTTRPAAVATINNNENGAARVRLELRRGHDDDGTTYTWITADGYECGLGVFHRVADARSAARQAWGGGFWQLRMRG